MSTQEDPPDGKTCKRLGTGIYIPQTIYGANVWDSSEIQVQVIIIFFLAKNNSFMINEK